MARSPASLIAGVVVFGGLLALGSQLSSRAAPGGLDPSDPCFERYDDPSCDFADEGAAFEGAPAMPEGPVLSSEVCRDRGYLCVGMASRREDRVMRWLDDTEVIRVRVLQPEYEDGLRQREYQSAAIRGVLTWSENPFPLRVIRDQRGTADIEIRWARSLGGNQLGMTSTNWTMRDGIRVLSLTLVTRQPGNPNRRLPASQVGLTAAHEMGHALGLPHSNNRRDVMYPTNTAARLTAADYETMRGLYGLENGARIDLTGFEGN